MSDRTLKEPPVSKPDPEILKQIEKHIPSELRSLEVADKILEQKREEIVCKHDSHPMATYRVEVQFGATRSTRKPVPALLRCWESGKLFNGKGDVSMHFCGNPHCHKPFPNRHLRGDYVVCPHCFQTFTREQTTTTIKFVVHPKDLAYYIAELFLFFKGDCDVVVKWIKEDIRLYENARWNDFQNLEAKSFQTVVYPYFNIIKDTADGRSLIPRLKELLG